MKEKHVPRKNINFLKKGDMWESKMWASGCEIMGAGICLKCGQEHNLSYLEAHGVASPFFKTDKKETQ